MSIGDELDLTPGPEFVDATVDLGQQAIDGDIKQYDELEKIRERGYQEILAALEADTTLTSDQKARCLRQLNAIHWKMKNVRVKNKNPIRAASVAQTAMMESFQLLREHLNDAAGLDPNNTGDN